MERIPEKTSSETMAQGHHSILIVEDERLMLRLLEKFFSQHGYHVLVAPDGEHAIEVYRCYKHRIDAVLLDVGLPKISGSQVLSKIKEENPDVRVIIASGYLEPKIKSGMSYAGVKHFVNKPYMLDQVIHTIQSVIETQ